MGLGTSSLLLCRRRQQLRVLILGLDAAGKTTLLYRLKTGTTVTTIPTIGFNVEDIVLEGRATLTLWDVGGRDKMRSLYRHYLHGTQGLFYVIDGTDRERLTESIDELCQLTESMTDDGLQELPIAILCNKCDLPDAGSTRAEVQKRLESSQMSSLMRRHPCSCFAVSAVTGDGVTEALDWLVQAAAEVAGTAGKTAKVAGDDVATKAEVSGWSDLYQSVKSAILR